LAQCVKHPTRPFRPNVTEQSVTFKRNQRSR
jgi:hypothetical protein